MSEVCNKNPLNFSTSLTGSEKKSSNVKVHYKARAPWRSSVLRPNTTKLKPSHPFSRSKTQELNSAPEPQARFLPSQPPPFSANELVKSKERAGTVSSSSGCRSGQGITQVMPEPSPMERSRAFFKITSLDGLLIRSG